MEKSEEFDRSETDIAIVSLAGRFPGAATVDGYWHNIENGIESITFFTETDLVEAGMSLAEIRDPNYVRARAALEGADLFDAEFFGINAREAQILDPQQRIFLECAWEALEGAGYDPSRFPGRIGVFGGCSMNTYLFNLYSDSALMKKVGAYQVLIASDKDFLTTRVSYKLGLTGPSIAVQTACSTSLVAVHLACQSLLNGECDMALAGGVSISVPQKGGHMYHEGSFLSPDGHCRAFDADAQGTVSGDGCGIAVLRRLDNAMASRDPILAIIKGSAINNDGDRKAGFTAPSVKAQGIAIAEAMAMAEVEPETIELIEAHGTGTPLGDPIELAALKQAFKGSEGKKRYCALGSVKTNIGHLDAAAGIAGLIKATLALKNKVVPASLNFQAPNPKLGLEDSPFYVNTRSREWRSRGLPRRAGVSSFGVGGTNAHVVLQEAPEPAAEARAMSRQLLLVSARTHAALQRSALNLADHIERTPEISLADAAYTLQAGRAQFPHRRYAVCRDGFEAVDMLRTADRLRSGIVSPESPAPSVVFMFPGQGSQYPNMARELYELDACFKENVDRCCDLLVPSLGLDLRTVLYPGPDGLAAASKLLNQTHITQPALFVIEYSLGDLLVRWGVKPRAMIGHSLGEYVAACLAGVFTLEDALKLVSVRGKAMQDQPPGAMIAAEIGEEEVRPLMSRAVSIAAVNSPSESVLSGAEPEIDRIAQQLSERSIRFLKLPSSRAFHSPLMLPARRDLMQQMSTIRPGAVSIPFVSNVTGRWVTDEQAASPEYWADQMVQSVRFAPGLRTIFNSLDCVLVEVGPGKVLASLAKRQLGKASSNVVLSTLGTDGEPALQAVLEAIGGLWQCGVNIDWEAFHKGYNRRRIPLPTYPFERKRFWVEGTRVSTEASQEADRVVPVAPQMARPELNTEYEAPSTELEESIAELWQDLMGIEKLGVNDDFFRVGGHSLLATQLVAELRDTFEIDLPLQRLFQAPTVAQLAAVVEELLVARIETLSDDEVDGLLDSGR
jgi:phthiocerol/phenolphthiocerol synthesis type-I polyketide synthase E